MTNSSQVKIGPKPLAAVQNNEEEEDNVGEFIGFLTFSTTGEALVPRDWLLEQWENYGIPKTYLPKQPSHWSAYRRMKNELLEDVDYRHYTVHNKEYNRDFTCKFELEKSDEMGSNIYILYTKVFFPEELIGEEGGDWRPQRLGWMEFYQPEDGGAPGQLLTHFEEAKDTPHHEATKRLANRARELFQKMKTHHNYSDLQKVMDDFRYNANAVPVRRAVYFIGSHHQETIEGLSRLWQDMNQFKEGGEKMRIETTPVVNIESQREMVADRVREEIQGRVDDAVNGMLSKFEEDDELTTDATARKIMDKLSDTHGISAEYNELLSLRLSIKDILEERQKELADEQEEIINSVINQSDLDDY